MAAPELFVAERVGAPVEEEQCTLPGTMGRGHAEWSSHPARVRVQLCSAVDEKCV